MQPLRSPQALIQIGGWPRSYASGLYCASPTRQAQQLRRHRESLLGGPESQLSFLTFKSGPPSRSANPQAGWWPPKPADAP